MKAIIVLCLFVAIGFTYIACDQTDDLSTQHELGEIIELRIGEHAQIKNTDIYFDFNEITEDSRCPNKTQCIWEGRAMADLRLGINQTQHEFSLISRNSSPQLAEKTVDNRTIRLVNVSPYPEANEVIKKEDYVISVVVE